MTELSHWGTVRLYPDRLNDRVGPPARREPQQGLADVFDLRKVEGLDAPAPRERHEVNANNPSDAG